MQQRNLAWEDKIRFFSKLVGFEDPELEETLDETSKATPLRKPIKGIKIIQ